MHLGQVGALVKKQELGAMLFGAMQKAYTPGERTDMEGSIQVDCKCLLNVAGRRSSREMQSGAVVGRMMN